MYRVTSHYRGFRGSGCVIRGAWEAENIGSMGLNSLQGKFSREEMLSVEI